MADNQIPTPPQNPDLIALHKHIIQLNNWLGNMFLTGNQATHLTQDTLNKMTSNNDLKQAGKIFYNTDMNKMQKATIVSGNLTITDF